MWSRIRSIALPSLAMAVIWLAGASPANAILVRGGIDPQFSTSGTLSDLYWTALIEFDVGANCLLPDLTVNCPVSNLSVTGTLQYKPSLGTPGPVLNIDFLPSDPSPPTSLDLAVNTFDQIIGIGSGPIGFATMDAVGNPLVDMRPLLDVGNVWVQFFLPGQDPNFPQSTVGTGGLIVQPCRSTQIASTTEEEHESSEAETHENDNDEDGPGLCNALTSPDGGLTSSVLGVVNITQVPEPGSAWLVLAALLMATPVLTRRKLRR